MPLGASQVVLLARQRRTRPGRDAAFVHPVTVRGQPVTVREQRRAAGYAAWERRGERPMLVLALVFLVVLVVPMVADLPPTGAHGLHRRRRRDLGGLRGRLRRPPLPGAGSMALRPVPPARPARACPV